jgi:hypothetical protein
MQMDERKNYLENLQPECIGSDFALIAFSNQQMQIA